MLHWYSVHTLPSGQNTYSPLFATSVAKSFWFQVTIPSVYLVNSKAMYLSSREVICTTFVKPIYSNKKHLQPPTS